MFLAKVTELDPDDPLGWLWRSALAEEPEQALIWLNRVLDIDPTFPQALRALPMVRTQAAIAVARCGDFHTARHLFKLAAEADADSIVPWLELASLARTPEEARSCLDEVLRRDPTHTGARECIERIERERLGPSAMPTPLSLEVPVPQRPQPAAEAFDDRLIPVSFEPPAEFGGPAAAPAPVVREPHATVLVVDDNDDVRAFVHRHLEPLGVRVLSASGANEAIALLRDCDTPNAILIDGVMPGVDGFELCNLLRQDREFARTPMILLASKQGVLSNFKGMMSGFNERLVKPISPISLRAALGKYFPLHDQDEDAESWPELPEEVLR